MSDQEWVRIRSWHAVKVLTTRAGWTITRCGRMTESIETSDTLPLGKSCETCLRVIARLEDHA